MTERDHIKQLVSALTGGQVSFDETMHAVYRYQVKENPLFSYWAGLLKRTHPENPAFLPVEMFKNHQVKSGKFEAEEVFVSSGTTGSITSRHFVRENSWYLHMAEESFRFAYGNAEDFCFLCLLPSYLERQGSSLVYMAEHFIRKSRYPESGFYLYAGEKLFSRLSHVQKEGIPTILLGVSFALLDFAESNPVELGHSVKIMETGGMKGRRKEMVREELHAILCQAFGANEIHSEYGMTEMLSQAYSKGNGLFHPPPQMKVIITDINDPTETVATGKTGMVNIIDLGNIDSCAFIATKDLGRVYADGSFEILGRYDYSDVRGCNLLIA